MSLLDWLFQKKEYLWRQIEILLKGEREKLLETKFFWDTILFF